MIKRETIEQLGGFGSDKPISVSEHYKSSGFMRKSFGIATTGFIETLNIDDNNLNLGTVFAFAFGKGREIELDNEENNSYYAVDTNNKIYKGVVDYTNNVSAVLTDLKVAYKTSTDLKGIIVDQKKRILYPQEQWLGMYDPSVSNYTTGTVSATNGSTTVTGTGTTFTADMATNKRVIRFKGEDSFYRITTRNSNTEIILDSAYQGTTGAGKEFIVYEAWTDEFKDFGSTLSDTSINTTAFTDCETYEDTVLFGRNNKIMTLSTSTDTINTSAFDMPTGFDILKIESGSNGILLGCNFRKKGVLVLWDNYSDRSVAPWIYLQEPLIGVSKYSGGWIVQTTRRIFYTNGYSITDVKEDFLGTSFKGTDLPNTQFYPNQTETVGNNFYFKVSIPTRARKRQGLYKLNLDTKLMEYYPLKDRNSYGIDITALGADSDQILAGVKSTSDTGDHIGFLDYDNPTPISSFISYGVGQGNNDKVAEGIDIDVAVDSYYSGVGLSNISFEISAKIADASRQINHYAVSKAGSIARNKVYVNGKLYGGAEKGDEIEFLDGANAGYTRHISEISGQDTDTEIWTLDESLPSSIETSKQIAVSPFTLIERKQYSDLTRIKNVYFDVKNNIEIKKALIKLEITNASVPLEIKAIDFIYDDMGILE